MKIKSILLISFVLLTKFVFSQKTIAPVIYNGYQEAVKGEVWPYFSSYPQFASEALLTRCRDNMWIEWTIAIPENIDRKAPYQYFKWLSGHSSGTSSADRNFDLFINGTKYLSFTTPQKKKVPCSWSFSGIDSTSVRFDATDMDMNADIFGTMYLRVPTKLLTEKTLKVSINGQQVGSPDWFMVFKYAFQEKLRAKITPLQTGEGAQAKRLVILDVDHIPGNPDTLDIFVDGQKHRLQLKPGYNYLEVPVTSYPDIRNIPIKAVSGNKVLAEISPKAWPVKHRDIYIVHHSHNDIGYSHLQEDVEQIQNDNIRTAIRESARTKNYPEGARLIWNIESLWAVENFLKKASREEKDAFWEAVKDKRIALSANYANIMTGLCQPEEMDWIIEYGCKLRDSLRVPLKTAMMTDIPGMHWSTVYSLAKQGVRYFSNGPNYMERMMYGGDRIGFTLKEHGDKPFWWKSPEGKDSILLWTAGKGYSWFHSISPQNLPTTRREKFLQYCAELDSTGYPFNMVQMRYTIKSDNGPVDTTLADFVAAWNKHYSSPKLYISNVNTLFEKFEKENGKQIPSLSGDFTPYWEDGAYSTAKEETDARLTSMRIIQLENLAKQKKKTIPRHWLYQAHRGIVMFHEHTWGAWCSISDPDSPFTKKQWAYKKAFLDTAIVYTEKIERFLLNKQQPSRKIIVHNTLSWKRDGIVETEIPEACKGMTLVDDKGQPVLGQVLSTGLLCFRAENIPANGKKEYHFESKVTIPANQEFSTDISFTIDSILGSIKDLRTGDLSFVRRSFDGIQQALYIKGLNGKPELSLLKKIEWREQGPLLKKVTIKAELEGTRGVEYNMTIFNKSNRVYLSTTIDAKPIRDKESFHIGFPFYFRQPTIRVNAGDQYFEANTGQLAGANRDFFSVQRWLDISEEHKGVTMVSPQVALFETGSPTSEAHLSNGERDWKRKADVSGNVFLYALNNYWHTNFKADQEGKVVFDIYLLLHHDFNALESDRFAKEMLYPLILENTK